MTSCSAWTFIRPVVIMDQVSDRWKRQCAVERHTSFVELAFAYAPFRDKKDGALRELEHSCVQVLILALGREVALV